MHTEDSGIRASRNQNDGDGIKTKAVYDYGTITIIPYVEVNGMRTIPDERLKDIYNRMANEGTLSTVFYGSQINSEADFINFFKNGSNFICVAFLDKEMCGFTWINSLNETYAFMHFCFFKEFWGKRMEGIGKACFDYYKSWNRFKVFIGMIPDFNKRAIKFAKRMGYVELGTIPEMVKESGMTILYGKT
jgi:RimJ/RimL family protein N-acetyltransferase